MRTDEQLKGDYELRVDDNVLRLLYRDTGDAVEAETDRQTEIVYYDVLQLLGKRSPQQFDVIVDTSSFSVPVPLPKKSRQLFSELLKHPQIRRVAVIGQTSMQSSITSFLLSLLPGYKKIAWFSLPAEAELWLRS